MAGYFIKLWELLSKAREEKDKIREIHVFNTSNVCKEFRNIEIEVIFLNDCLGGYVSKLDGMTKADYEHNRKLSQESERLRFMFNVQPFRIECGFWREVASTGISVAKDIHNVFELWEIKIPVRVTIRNHELKFGINGFVDFDSDVYEEMKDLDCHDFLGDWRFLELKGSEVNKLKDEIEWLHKRISEFEILIRNRKDAYLLSKFIDNKITRKGDYKKYPELIKAFDAYIDVKKVMSQKPYC